MESTLDIINTIWQYKKKIIFVKVITVSTDNSIIYYRRVSGKRGEGRLLSIQRQDFLDKYKIIEYSLK